MSFRVPANQTVSYSVYFQTVCLESGLTHEFIRAHEQRILRAFDFGEPIWMIVGEIKIVHETTPIYQPTKTPKQLARRVVRI